MSIFEWSETEIRFGSDEEPGIRRRGTTRFTYVDERSRRSPERLDRERIRALAVPPAWTDVWIASDPASHVQATGRDARGRKQYRYHPDFTRSRSEGKFADLVVFGNQLGRLRHRVRRDLAKRHLAHDQIVAVVVRLLDVTGLRIGNPEYVRDNGSFGLTTLQNGHAAVRGSTINLAFRGKSAHEFDVTVQSAPLARIIRKCQHLPGQQLFQYRATGGELRLVTSSDVNAYLTQHGGTSMSAKTFRTWNATVLATHWLAQAADDGADATIRTVNDVIDRVADHLGNTRSVCRTSYVHPAVVDSFLDSTLTATWRRRVGQRPAGLTIPERRALRILRKVADR